MCDERCMNATETRDLCPACLLEYESWLDERERPLSSVGQPQPQAALHPIHLTPTRPTLTVIRCN